MARSSAAIIKDLERFDPVETGWERLGELLEELLASPSPEQGAEALLGVFERWPGALTGGPGGGWFWSVMHALESFQGYEPHLLRSLQRKPSVLSVMMTNRLLNGGVSAIEGVPLVPLLQEKYAIPTTMRTVKEEIEPVLERHKHQPTRLKKRRAQTKKKGGP